MYKFQTIQQKTILATLALNIALFIITVLIDKAIAWGFIFGMCFGVINFNLRCKSANQLVERTASGNSSNVGKQFLNFGIRYLLYAVAIFITLQYNELNIISTVFSLISVNLILVITSLISNQENPTSNKKSASKQSDKQ